MQEIPWFERKLTFGATKDMLPYFLERLSGTIVRIAAKIKAVPNDVLSAQYHGKWSVKQNIGHLAEVDEINYRRIGEMLAGISPMSPAVFEPKGVITPCRLKPCWITSTKPGKEILLATTNSPMLNLAKHRSIHV
jgi:hypothetical protein